MTDWFRSWHGAPIDPKWLGIARRVGVAPGIVAAVVWALMDRASQADDRGSIEGYDAEGLAAFFGCEETHVEEIVGCMIDRGMIAHGRFTAWEKRQPKREDDATERTRAWRERNRTQRYAPVTQRDAPDTETEKIQKEGANAPYSSEPKNAPSAVAHLPTVSEGEVPIFEADVAEWQQAFPAVNVPQQLAAMRSWLVANQAKRKTKRGMRKFVVSWLDRKQNAAATPSQRATAPPRQQESVIDAFNVLDEQGFFSEQAGGTSHNGNAQRLSTERGGGQAGALVDLRPSIVRRIGSGDH